MRASFWTISLTVSSMGCGHSPAIDPTPVQPASLPVAVMGPASQDAGYFATYAEPCGRALLELRTSPEATPLRVVPRGANNPVQRLRFDMLVRGRFVVFGQFVQGETSDDAHCGSFPVFEVTRFEPWGPIRRCTSIGAADPGMYRYTELLPDHEYVAEDFADGSEGRLLDDDGCTPRPTGKTCAAPLVTQTACDETVYCCAEPR